MQLTCPTCGERIPAQQINVQQMTAVCPTCHEVFGFQSPHPPTRSSRRKAKQPEHLTMRDADVLRLSFRTNFRLDRSEAFFNGLTGSMIFSLAAMSTLNAYFLVGAPLIMPLLFALGTVGMYYRLALLLYNQTHIVMDDDTLRVSRQPLPSLVDDTRTIHLSGVVGFSCEETPISIERQYDTPRYTVWARYADGTREMVVQDVIADYGYFITQQLEERLYDTPDVSRLAEQRGWGAFVPSVYDLAEDADVSERRGGG